MRRSKLRPIARARRAGPAIMTLMERRHPKLDRITFDPGKCAGKPCVRGLRMTVEALVGYLGAGMTIEEILREWPELEEEDIRQALTYAAWQAGDRVVEFS